MRSKSIRTALDDGNPGVAVSRLHALTLCAAAILLSACETAPSGSLHVINRPGLEDVIIGTSETTEKTGQFDPKDAKGRAIATGEHLDRIVVTIKTNPLASQTCKKFDGPHFDYSEYPINASATAEKARTDTDKYLQVDFDLAQIASNQLCEPGWIFQGTLSLDLHVFVSTGKDAQTPPVTLTATQVPHR